MTPEKKILFGQVLVRRGKVAENELDEALKLQSKSKEPLGLILTKLGYITEEDVTGAVAEQAGLPRMELDIADIQHGVTQYVPFNLARRHNTVPIKVEGNVLHLATDTIPAGHVITNLSRMTGKQVKFYIAPSSLITSFIKNLYKSGASAGAGVSRGTEQSATDVLDDLLSRALIQKASDVHIEQRKDSVNVRIRIDGVLKEISSLSSSLGPPLISRVKILSRLDIAEKPAPQDGSFMFDSGSGSSVDIRVSVLPNIDGEKAVLRLLPSRDRKITLESLGMERDTLEIYKSLIQRPHGIILITGPTGSGKSTTLYASLLLIRAEGINITTVEDPVEYQIEGVTQTQVDSANKISFARALRHILRQDPDIIMIGEIRDKETADLALQAALTGHLVFSTLHTNDAPSALTRLVDMGCEPFLISSTVSGILAQRLIRQNCESCKEQFEPTPDEMKKLGLTSSQKNWYCGKKCHRCNETGYRGRTGIFELLTVNDAIRQEIIKSSSAEQLRDVAISNGMRGLREDSFLKIESGLTTPEEALRVTVLD